MTPHAPLPAPRHDEPNAPPEAPSFRVVTSGAPESAARGTEAPIAEAPSSPPPRGGLPRTAQVVLALLLGGAAAGGYLVWGRETPKDGTERSEPAAKAETASARAAKPFVPTAAQLATFTLATVSEKPFQREEAAEGKISVDDDRTTPIFSPYAGRVGRLVVRQGQTVRAGDVLFTLQATDMVQAQTDLLAAQGALNKARSQLQLAQTVERRARDLYEAKAGSLRDYQSAQNDSVAAQNDLKAAEAGLDAVRNRLSILGKTESEIATFLEKGRINSETPIVSPIDGTVITRRVGPGQFIAAGATDPAYVVGDLSRVWLLASVREADAPYVKVGQRLTFRALAAPDRVFETKVSHVGASVDPTTRRITVRAEVENADGFLKPEMFASVRIATGLPETSPAVPRRAVIYEGDTARVWVLRPDGAAELRQVATGLVSGDEIQIRSGLKVGERIVTRGALFIDRLAVAGDP